MAGSVTFRPERSDYVAVARGSFLRGIRRRRFRVRLLIALLIAIGLGLAIGLLEGDEPLIEPVMWAVGAMTCWVAIVLVGCWLLIPRRVGRLFEQQRSLRHDFTVEWDSQGTTERWSTGMVHTPWVDYGDWFDNGAVFAFGLNDQLYHFIPTRVLDRDTAADLRRCAGAIADRTHAA